MLLKIIMREENMVLGIFILLKHLSLYWKFWCCFCFTFLCLLLWASLIYFFTRFLCVGSGLHLNEFNIFFLILNFTSILISYVSIFWKYRAYLNGYKERALGRQHLLFLLSVLFCFLAGNKWLDPSILVWIETRSVFIV